MFFFSRVAVAILGTVQGTGMRNAARLWPGASNMAIRRLSRLNAKATIILNIEQRTKRSCFSRAQAREGIS